MSFGLGRGRELDDAPGVVGVSVAELPALPDGIGSDPRAGWVDPRGWFGEPGRALEIEVGCGKGTFLVQQALLRPGVNYLGVEWAGEFYLYAADRVRRRRERGVLQNVRVLRADATSFVRWRVASGVARVVHLYFSDPWPKARHHKKRVVQDRFLGEVWRVLEEGGELRVVTDHAGLWAWDEEHFARWCGARGWEMLAEWGLAGGVGAGEGGAGPYERRAFARAESAEGAELVGSNFERKFRREGRELFSGVMRKRGASVG